MFDPRIMGDRVVFNNGCTAVLLYRHIKDIFTMFHTFTFCVDGREGSEVKRTGSKNMLLPKINVTGTAFLAKRVASSSSNKSNHV